VTVTSKRPNFFIVGAARSGTTALGRYLTEHPQVYMSPIKEPSYFAGDIIPELRPDSWDANQQGLEAYLNGPMRHSRGGCVLDWEEYLKLFRNVTDERAVGEASTAYLLSPGAAGQIRAAIPKARIIMILRNPIEQAFSTFLMFRRNGRLRYGFSEILRSEDSGLAQWRRFILETHRTAEGVNRFLATFPPDQIRWYLHEEFSSDPLLVVRDAYAFLEVDPTFLPDVSRRYNESVVPRVALLQRVLHVAGISEVAGRIIPSRLRPLVRGVFFYRSPIEGLPGPDRTFLADYFRDEVVTLSRLLKRDLSYWMGPE